MRPRRPHTSEGSTVYWKRVASDAKWRLAPQLLRRDTRAFDERLHFCPAYGRVHSPEAREVPEAAVRAGDDSFPADEVRIPAYALCDTFRVLDEVCRRIENARHQHLVVGQLCRCEQLVLVIVPRIAAFDA